MNDCWFIRLLDALSSEDCRLVTKLSEIWANSLFFFASEFHPIHGRPVTLHVAWCVPCSLAGVSTDQNDLPFFMLIFFGFMN
jgi:hypothetical protein